MEKGYKGANGYKGGFLRGLFHNSLWDGVDNDAFSGETSVSPALRALQLATRAQHAFQVVFALPYEPINCFSLDGAFAVPARTLLSQLP